MKSDTANKCLFSWMNPKLEVRETDKYGKEILPAFIDNKKTYERRGLLGKGVFAKGDIKKGEMLMVMGGYILTIEDENELTGTIADKPIEISESFSIGPRKSSDLARMPQHYINHSCDPNAGFKGQIFIVAMKSIKSGTEIAYDYAMVMHANKESNSFFQFDCACGSKKCRKLITEHDWKLENLQTHYDGYFQFYLQEKINKKKR